MRKPDTQKDLRHYGKANLLPVSKGYTSLKPSQRAAWGAIGLGTGLLFAWFTVMTSSPVPLLMLLLVYLPLFYRLENRMVSK